MLQAAAPRNGANECGHVRVMPVRWRPHDGSELSRAASPAVSCGFAMHPDERAPLPVDRPAMAAWSTRQLALLLAITALAAMLRLFRIEVWSWSGAEAETWRAVTMPLAGEAGFVATPASYHPLAVLALRWLLDAGVLPGSGEGWLRLPFAFAGTLAVPLLAVLARGMIGNVAALVAALLLAIHPGHIHVCQSAQPLGLALVLGLIGVTAAQRRRRWIAAAALLAAGGCDPLGWSAAAVAGAGALPRRWQRGLLVAAALPAVSVSLLALPSLSLPVLVLAAAGLCVVQPLPLALALGAALPAAAAGAWALASGTLACEAVVALPALLLLATAALARTHELMSGRLPAPSPLSHVVPALGAAVAVAWLGTETFLYATIQHGRRPQWRAAALAALTTADSGGGLVVGAGAGAGSLTCYLRPNHWRLAADAHPGVAVVTLDLREPAAAVRGFAANPDPGHADPGHADPRHAEAAHVVLVLHADEVLAVTADPAAAAGLAGSFTLLYVVPGPAVTHDDTLWIYRRKPPR